MGRPAGVASLAGRFVCDPRGCLPHGRQHRDGLRAAIAALAGDQRALKLHGNGFGRDTTRQRGLRLVDGCRDLSPVSQVTQSAEISVK